MMTTNVKKGAGRPAAAAKSNKHAQRTPLPSKAGSPGAEAIAERKAEISSEFAGVTLEGEQRRYGVMTVAELRAVAKSLGVKGYSRMGKGDLLNAILAAERAQVTIPAVKSEATRAADAFAIAEKADRIGEILGDWMDSADPDKYADYEVGTVDEFGTVSEVSVMADGKKMISYADEEPVVVQEEAPEPVHALPFDRNGKSYAKAYAFGQDVLAAGWAYEMTPAEGEDRVSLIARRGSVEAIEIEWNGGVFVGDTCHYSHAGRSAIKLRNASHAKQKMAVPPAEAAQEAAKVAAHKSVRAARKNPAEATTAGRKALAFDVETASDEEVLAAVQGKKISWTNEVSGGIEDAYVVGKSSIQPGKSGRSIRFTSMTGFRSVRVSSIIAVR